MKERLKTIIEQIKNMTCSNFNLKGNTRYEEYANATRCSQSDQNKQIHYCIEEETWRLADKASKMILFMKYSLVWREYTTAVEQYREYSNQVSMKKDEINAYLMLISSENTVRDKVFYQLEKQVKLINLIELITEECDGIVNLANQMRKKEYDIPRKISEEMEVCIDITERLYHETLEVLDNGDLYVTAHIEKEREKLSKAVEECSKLNRYSTEQDIGTGTLDFYSKGIMYHIDKIANQCMKTVRKHQNALAF